MALLVEHFEVIIFLWLYLDFIPNFNDSSVKQKGLFSKDRTV